MLRDTGWVDLCHTGIAKVSALLVALPSCGSVGCDSVCREVEGVAVTARSDHYGMSCKALDGTRDQVARYDTSRTTVYDD